MSQFYNLCSEIGSGCPAAESVSGGIDTSSPGSSLPISHQSSGNSITENDGFEFDDDRHFY